MMGKGKMGNVMIVASNGTKVCSRLCLWKSERANWKRIAEVLADLNHIQLCVYSIWSHHRGESCGSLSPHGSKSNPHLLLLMCCPSVFPGGPEESRPTETTGIKVQSWEYAVSLPKSPVWYFSLLSPWKLPNTWDLSLQIYTPKLPKDI